MRFLNKFCKGQLEKNPLQIRNNFHKGIKIQNLIIIIIIIMIINKVNLE